MRSRKRKKFKRTISWIMAVCIALCGILTEPGFMSYGNNSELHTGRPSITVSMKRIVTVLDETNGDGIQCDWSSLPADITASIENPIVVGKSTLLGTDYYILAQLTGELWEAGDLSAIANAVTNISVVFVNQNDQLESEVPEVNFDADTGIEFSMDKIPEMIWEEADADPILATAASAAYRSAGIESASASNAQDAGQGNDSRILRPRSAKKITISITPKLFNATPEKMDFITGVEVTKQNNSPLPGTGVGIDDTVRIKYTYQIPTYAEGAPAPVVVGTPYTFSVPNEIDLDLLQPFDLKTEVQNDENPLPVGTVFAAGTVWDKTTRTMAITFNDNATAGKLLESEITGSFYFDARFDSDQIEHGGKVEIDFNEIGSGTLPPIEINFKLKKIGAEVLLEKNGSADLTTNRITWEIKVTPTMQNVWKTDNCLESLVITDTIKAGQNLTLNLPAVIKDEQGNLVSGGAIAYTPPTTGEDTVFTYTFPTLLRVDPDDCYTITYTTDFSLAAWNGGSDKVSFTNQVAGIAKHKQYKLDEVTGKAVFDQTEAGDFNLDPVSIKSAEKTVEVAGGFLTKTGQFSNLPNSTDGVISWTLIINKNGFQLGNIDLTDIIGIGNGETLNTSDFSEFNRWNSLNPLNVAPDETITPTITTTADGKVQAKLTLTNVTTPITLKYTTKVKAEYIKDNTRVSFTNAATIAGTPGPSVNSGNIVVWVGNRLITKSSSYNRSNHTITWKIQINQDQIPLTGTTVEDVIPEGLIYVDTEKDKATSTVSNAVITVTGSALKVTYPDSFSGTDTITFQTKIQDNLSKYWAVNSDTTPTELKNTATLKTIAGAQKNEYSAASDVRVISNVLKKTGAGYDSAVKEIDWELTLNENKMPMTNPVITEQIPKGQAYVTNSLTCAQGADQIKSQTYNEQTRILTIELKDISAQTILKLKTKLTDLKVLETNNRVTVSNTATLHCDEMGTAADPSVTAEQVVSKAMITKSGAPNNKDSLIKWKVMINENRVTVSNPVLTDTLNDKLILYTDSVKLTKIDAGNHRTDIPVTPENIDYNEQTNVFRFSFLTEIQDSYELEFDTYFSEDGAYTNTIDFMGSGVTTISGTSSSVNGNWTSGGGTSTRPSPGSIQVTKKDPEGAAICGAQFKLGTNGAVMTTDANGQLTFPKLKAGKYTVTEVSVPEKYIIDSLPNPVTVVSGKQTQITITNQVKKGSCTIQKVDGDVTPHLPLGDAEFTLYQKDSSGALLFVSDAAIRNPVTTDSKTGTAKFEHLPYTDYGYVVKESKAPAGYVQSSDLYSFNILENNKDYQQTFVNTKIKSNVTVNKIDSQTGERIPGATIQIIQTKSPFTSYSAVTLADGKARFSNLKYGSYRITEIKAPAGYLLSSTEIPVTVTNHEDEISVNLENESIKGTLVITKKAYGTETLLPGAEIALYRTDGTEVRRQITGADGKTAFELLPYGDYYYIETKAPEGYYADEKKHPATFHIAAVGEIRNEVLENHQISSSGNENGGRPSIGNSGDPSVPTLPGPGQVVQPDQTSVSTEETGNINPPFHPAEDGVTRVEIPNVPPRTPIIIENEAGERVYSGITNDHGGVDVALPPGIYNLFSLDENAVPLAHFSFVIEDVSVPLATLPKTGDRSIPEVLFLMIFLFSLCSLELFLFRRKGDHEFL